MFGIFSLIGFLFYKGCCPTSLPFGISLGICSVLEGSTSIFCIWCFWGRLQSCPRNCLSFLLELAWIFHTIFLAVSSIVDRLMNQSNCYFVSTLFRTCSHPLVPFWKGIKIFRVPALSFIVVSQELFSLTSVLVVIWWISYQVCICPYCFIF